ncbi:MAG TPA: PadR family transcriptional regulator [Candidatus Cybelea sp.]|jgi:DNA-binding PadR family transcriptional regulator
MKAADPHRELFVLGLLRGAESSAYDVDHAMREHVPLYRRFSQGNTYQFVERLAANGLLSRRAAATRRGPREQKWLYALSPDGETRFRELVRGIMTDVQSSDVALETALVLLGQLPRDDALELVIARAGEVERYERRLKRIYGEERGIGRGGAFTRLRIMHRMQSERRYLGEIAGLLRDAKWEPQWIAGDGERAPRSGVRDVEARKR